MNKLHTVTRAKAMLALVHASIEAAAGFSGEFARDDQDAVDAGEEKLALVGRGSAGAAGEEAAEVAHVVDGFDAFVGAPRGRGAHRPAGVRHRPRAAPAAGRPSPRRALRQGFEYFFYS